MFQTIRSLLEKNQTIAQIARYIHRKTFLKWKQYRRNKVFLENAEEALSRLDDTMNALQVSYWLEYGTLLGAYRDKAFLKHDIDIDIGLFLDDYSLELPEYMARYGFTLKREILIDNGQYGREETYSYKGIDIDLFYFSFTDDKSKIYTHDFKGEDGKSWTKTIEERGGLIVRERYFNYHGLEKISFLQKEFPVPAQVDEHLASVYGEDFMIPNASWNPYDKPQNVKILLDKIGKVVVH